MYENISPEPDGKTVIDIAAFAEERIKQLKEKL